MKNPFRLPTPKELGMSDSNALGLRVMTPFQDGPTWEDWDEKVKKEYPLRWWMNKASSRVINFIEHKFSQVLDAWYWIKCHTLKSFEFHKIDLRGVDPVNPYSFGYIDPDEAMLTACFAILRIYVEQCCPHDPEPPTESEEEQGVGDIIRKNKENYDEAMFLYDWWMNKRLEEKKEENRLFDLVELARTNKLEPEYTKASRAWYDYTVDMESRAQDMLIRLVKIRNSLWT